MRRHGRERRNRETTESENMSFDGHDDLVQTHHWRTDYEINTAILSLYRIYVHIRKGVLMCRGYGYRRAALLESPRPCIHSHVYARACACTYVRMRKTVDVCVKIDYTAGENVINSSTNKGLRRLYNANSKNRVGLRGLRREEDVWDRGKGVGGDRVARRSRNNTDACGYFKFAWHHRVQAALAHTLRVPFEFAPSASSLWASSEPTVPALICIRPIMSSDSPSHPRRHTSRPSIKPRLFLLQLTPTSPPGLDAFVARWSLPPTRTSLMRAHWLCVALQQLARISLTSGSPSTDDIVLT